MAKIDEIIKQRLVKAMGKACALIEADAKTNCPVDSGRLRNSIEYEINEDGDTIEGIVKATAPYAVYVEYGTGIWAESGKGRQTPWTYWSDKYGWITTTGQEPQPFMRPALLNNQDKIEKIIMEGVIGND